MRRGQEATPGRSPGSRGGEKRESADECHTHDNLADMFGAGVLTLLLATSTSAFVLRAPAVLSAEACAALRAAVDRVRSVKIDSTDGAAEHELPLTPAALEGVIGGAATRALFALPARFWRACGATADAIARPHDIFVRRYSAATRPWIGSSARTPKP